MSKKRFGKCHICGKNGKLSFEHLPPRAAFNQNTSTISRIEDILKNLNKPDFDDIKGRISQRGFGDYTLCQKCNNDTGGWYGGAYIEWAMQASAIINLSSGNPSLYYPFKIYPLRVLKQIICMFMSTNSPEFREYYPYLEEFVLNKKKKYLNPEIKVCCYYNTSGVAKSSGVSALLGTDGSLTSLSEFSYYPFGYIMFFNQSILSKDLIDITFFSRFPYDLKRTINFKFPSFEIYSWYPGDFRKREQFKKN